MVFSGESSPANRTWIDLVGRIYPVPLPGTLTCINARERHHAVYRSQSGGLSRHSDAYWPGIGSLKMLVYIFISPTIMVVKRYVSSASLLFLSPPSSSPFPLVICVVVFSTNAGWADRVVVFCFFDARSTPANPKIKSWIGAQHGFEPCFFVANRENIFTCCSKACIDSRP